MTPKERVKAVFEGKTPDRVPLLLDLSHWYKKNYNVPFDLSGLQKVEYGLVDLHKRLGAVSYVEMGRFYDLSTEDPKVTLESWTEGGSFHTRISTPEGILEEERVFDRGSYSYNIKKHLLHSVDDFPVVEYLMERLKCRPKWDYYKTWEDALGELAYIYLNLPYSGSGYLMARNMGVEKTVFAVMDYPDKVRSLIDSVNACNLRILDTVIDGPFDTLIISDNYDSNVQTKEYFDTYVRDYYSEVARRLHEKGKYLAIHVDGENRGIVKWLAECGVDCADAVTPAPMFSLAPKEIREQAGPELILSGGIPATEFGISGTDHSFTESVRRWLDTRHDSSRLFMAAGDQVPTDAPWSRIAMLPELVEKYGNY
jgi:hypothetical protein